MVNETYEDPIFNLKAVVEATGVTADALRAWERRYGLPQPQRTEAGHRIYSQRDIDIIRWLVARQDEGLRIGRAVRLWRRLEEEGQRPLREMPLPSAASVIPTGDRIADMREEWVSGCLAFDEQRAEHTLSRAFALFPIEVVCLDVIREGIAEIGRRWYAGEATVQQEHFASSLAMRRLKGVMNSIPRPTRRGRVLLACPPNEKHAIGPFILALLLRHAGWDVVYLGPDVPLSHMAQTVDATSPDVVVLAAQQLHTAGHLLEVAQSLVHQGVSVGFGGGIFNRLPALRRRIPGHFLGATLKEAVDETERLIVTAPEAPGVEVGSAEYHTALSHYLDQELAVRADVWRHLENAGLHQRTLDEIAGSFADALVAAVRFGDMQVLDEYVDWLAGADDQTGLSVQVFLTVLEAYEQAAKAHLDDRGAPIIDWLEQRVRQGARTERDHR